MKIIGYMISITGLAGFAAFAIPQLKAAIPIVKSLSDSALIAASLILLILGIVIIKKFSRIGHAKKGQEIPIYRGKKIIGYRRN